MELSSIIFPNPEFIHDIKNYKDELIFIPKIDNYYTILDKNLLIKNSFNNNIKNNSKIDYSKYYKENISKQDIQGYIPCLFLESKIKNKISKNFLLYFHGNAEDIFYAREIADRIRNNLSINIVLIEYPGYSIYKESKSSKKILEDAIYVFDYLTNILSVNPNHIYVLGRSIGSAPSCYLSSKRNFAGLILMSPFTSIQNVAKNLVGILSFVVAERFNNIDYLKSCTCPVLFIHGQNDNLIPFSHTLALKNVCLGPVEINLPEEMDHNKFDYECDLLFPLKDFLRRNTSFYINEYCDTILPSHLYDIPDNLKDGILNSEINQVKYGCFGIKNK